MSYSEVLNRLYKELSKLDVTKIVQLRRNSHIFPKEIYVDKGNKTLLDIRIKLQFQNSPYLEISRTDGLETSRLIKLRSDADMLKEEVFFEHIVKPVEDAILCSLI